MSKVNGRLQRVEKQVKLTGFELLDVWITYCTNPTETEAAAIHRMNECKAEPGDNDLFLQWASRQGHANDKLKQKYPYAFEVLSTQFEPSSRKMTLEF